MSLITETYLEGLDAYNVIVGRPNVCLISDRHAGLLAAIRQLQEGSPFSPPIWPDVVSRWCVRHMTANFYERFKNKDLMIFFVQAIVHSESAEEVRCFVGYN